MTIADIRELVKYVRVVLSEIAIHDNSRRMGRRTVGSKKDDTITIRVPKELKDRIRHLMVGPYQHMEFQQMVLLLIEKGIPIHQAGVIAESWQRKGWPEEQGDAETKSNVT